MSELRRVLLQRQETGGTSVWGDDMRTSRATAFSPKYVEETSSNA